MADVLKILNDAVTNTYYKKSLKIIAERIVKGTTLSEAMKTFPRSYPKQFINIVATGEKSGTLTESFSYLADFYSKEVLNKTKRIPIIIEPLLLIFMATVVGLIALAIIMPIYQLIVGVGGG